FRALLRAEFAFRQSHSQTTEFPARGAVHSAPCILPVLHHSLSPRPAVNAKVMADSIARKQTQRCGSPPAYVERRGRGSNAFALLSSQVPASLPGQCPPVVS